MCVCECEHLCEVMCYLSVCARVIFEMYPCVLMCSRGHECFSLCTQVYTCVYSVLLYEYQCVYLGVRVCTACECASMYRVSVCSVLRERRAVRKGDSQHFWVA